MNDDKQVTAADRPSGELGERKSTLAIRPPVDVFENANGITLRADLPGVSNEQLDLQIDKDTLKIEAEMAFAMPESLQPLHAEVRTTRYQRSFALSPELDVDAVEASLKDGVLEVRLPKRSEHQPRKISVSTA